MNKLSKYDKKYIKQKVYSTINIHTHSQIVVSALSVRNMPTQISRELSQVVVSAWSVRLMPTQISNDIFNNLTYECHITKNNEKIRTVEKPLK